jgi:pilus assembly protein CpaC
LNTRASRFVSILITVFTIAASAVSVPALPSGAETKSVPAQDSGPPFAPSANQLSMVVGKSTIVSSEPPIESVSVGFGEVAEVQAVSPHEVLVNAKTAGSTSMIIWQQGGGKLLFDLNVRPNPFVMDTHLDNIRREIAKELPDQDIAVSSENEAIFLRGTAKDLLSVQRAVAIASTSGKVVDLMYVNVPPPETQILLKVRFASVDRSNLQELSQNLFSGGLGNTIGSTATGQFPSPSLPASSATAATGSTGPFTLSEILNIFLYNKNINLGTVITALQQKSLLQVLAEPNLLAENGREASFLAGGQVPYPIFQGTSAGTGSITIQFKEYGIRLNFIPTITPNGNIRLQVAPEVSALDYANAVTISGFSVPALTVRRVQTVVELQDGQSFAIGGLLDRSITKTLSKIPFIGDVPILGKLFQSKSVSQANTDLLVIVTPEIVRPMPAGSPPMDLKYPLPFMELVPGSAGQTHGQTVPAPLPPQNQPVPVETLLDSLKSEKSLGAGQPSQAGNSTAMPQQNTGSTANPLAPNGPPQP